MLGSSLTQTKLESNRKKRLISIIICGFFIYGSYIASLSLSALSILQICTSNLKIIEFLTINASLFLLASIFVFTRSVCKMFYDRKECKIRSLKKEELKFYKIGHSFDIFSSSCILISRVMILGFTLNNQTQSLLKYFLCISELLQILYPLLIGCGDQIAYKKQGRNNKEVIKHANIMIIWIIASSFFSILSVVGDLIYALETDKFLFIPKDNLPLIIKNIVGDDLSIYGITIKCIALTLWAVCAAAAYFENIKVEQLLKKEPQKQKEIDLFSVDELKCNPSALTF